MRQISSRISRHRTPAWTPPRSTFLAGKSLKAHSHTTIIECVHGAFWGARKKGRIVGMGGLLVGEMEDWYWFLLGMIAALAPSFLVLTVFLARSMERSAGTEEPRE